MSPVKGPAQVIVMGFPRVSGDEPLETAAEETAVEFSPRERG